MSYINVVRILHFSSMAGIGEMLAYEANKLGHQSFVIQKRDLDPFGFGDYYKDTVYIDSIDKYMQLLFDSSRNSDVVIVHDWIEFLDEIECPNIYVYFHGSKLRSLPKEQIETILSKVKGIILSTPDLKEYCQYGNVLPQCVDYDLFYDYGFERSFDQMTINRKYQRDFIEPRIRQRFPNCIYYERNNSRPIPFHQMPETLNRWKEYVDVKFDYSKPEPKIINARSTTGLQALACGCKVYDYDGNIVSKNILPKHDSKQVVKEFLNLIAN